LRRFGFGHDFRITKPSVNVTDYGIFAIFGFRFVQASVDQVPSL
jgi:hypothetical protein